MKITEYKLIRESFAYKLEDEVNKFIKEGWQPYGFLVIEGRSGEYNDIWYCQSMVRLEAQVDEPIPVPHEEEVKAEASELRLDMNCLADEYATDDAEAIRGVRFGNG